MIACKKRYLLWMLASIGWLSITHSQLHGSLPVSGQNIWHLAAQLATDTDQLETQIDAEFNSTFTSLQTLQTSFDNLCSKIDNLTTIVTEDFAGTFTVIASLQCTSTVTTNTLCTAQEINIPSPATSHYSISAPGSYCLANDVDMNNFVIVINSSDVTFDLNNHTITSSSDGIEVQTNRVTIKNGNLKFSGVASSKSIVLLNNTNIFISDLEISNFFRGIEAAGTINNLSINNCVINDSTDHSIFLDQATNITINNCQFNSSTTPIPAVTIATNGSNCYIANCQANNAFFAINAGSRFVLDACTIYSQSPSNGIELTSPSNFTLRNCSVTAGAQGYFINSGSNGLIIGCIADACTSYGFHNQTNNTVFIDCIAQNNGSHGFFVEGVTNCLLRQCCAKSNGTAGTDDGININDASSKCTVSQCIAANNATNGFYVGATLSQVEKSTATANSVGFDTNLANAVIFYLNNASNNTTNFSANVLADTPPSAPFSLLTSFTRLYGDNLVSTY